MKKETFMITSTVKSNLKQLGENIKLARLRRGLPMRIICERASISRPTLVEVEKGSPHVSIGIYAMVLHALQGNSGELAKVMREDELGRTIQDLNIKTPKRIRK